MLVGSCERQKGAPINGNIWKLPLVIPKGMKNYSVIKLEDLLGNLSDWCGTFVFQL